MQEFVTQFENYLRIEKKSSLNTLESYTRDLGQFLTYCEMNEIIDISRVDLKTIEKFFEYLTVIGKSNATVSRVAASLRCFFNYLIKNLLIYHFKSLFKNLLFIFRF